MREVSRMMSFKLWRRSVKPVAALLEQEPDQNFNRMVNEAIQLYLRQKQAESQQYSADIEKAPA